MALIGIPLLTTDTNGAPSEHFGKAKWLGVFPDDGVPSVHRNNGLNGGAVTRLFAEAGCTDVLVRGIGGGALQHLKAAGIRAWRIPEGADVAEALAAFEAGRLPQVEVADHGGHHHGGGCC